MVKKEVIRVLLVEDDPMVQEVNRQFIESVPGFEVIHIASNGEEGLHQLKQLKPDLVILDIYMPEQDGVSMMERIRSNQVDVDIMVITAANDKDTIRKMLQNGAIDYIVKPFKFERLEQSLKHYFKYYSNVSSKEEFRQHEIDHFLGPVLIDKAKKNPDDNELPKGLNAQTLKQILLYLQGQTESVSAEEAADGVGIARVTARRYLDYLQKSGEVEMDIQYGGVGRPVNKYKIE